MSEHAARQLSKNESFEKTRRKDDRFGRGIHAIFGMDGRKQVLQSIAFDPELFTPDAAMEWLKDNGHKSRLVKAKLAVSAALKISDCDRSGFEAISAAVDDRKTFRKEIMKVGEFRNGQHRYSIKPSTLENWAHQFSVMEENGVKVPMPNTHDAAENPDANRGYVKSMFVDDDVLVMTCEMIGEDAIAAVERCDVSVYSPPEYRDGEGSVYERPITHVALVTNPVVPGLGEFIPLAASLRREEYGDMDFEKIQTALGVDDELNADNATDVICAALEERDTTIKTRTKELESAKGEMKTVRASMKSKGTEKPAPLLVTIAADSRRTKLNNLVERGRITPAVCASLANIFVGDPDAEEKNAPLVAALTTDPEQATETFDALCAALMDNDPVVLGEKSGMQAPVRFSQPKDDSRTNNALTRSADRMAKEQATLQGN